MSIDGENPRLGSDPGQSGVGRQTSALEQPIHSEVCSLTSDAELFHRRANHLHRSE